MKVKFYPEEKLRREIISIIRKYIDLDEYRVFFFGSRVSEKANERSDIDVGIEGPKSAPIETIARIREELSSLPTLYSIDVVDFGSASEDFKKVAKEHVEMISPHHE